jgi:hypothetical protein
MVGSLTLDHQRAVADLVSGDEESWHGSMVARLPPDAIPRPSIARPTPPAPAARAPTARLRPSRAVPYDREPWLRLLPSGTWSRATVSGLP